MTKPSRMLFLALLLTGCAASDVPPQPQPPVCAQPTVPGTAPEQEKDGGLGGTGHKPDPCADAAPAS
jgi:hypothetical protein